MSERGMARKVSREVASPAGSSVAVIGCHTQVTINAIHAETSRAVPRACKERVKYISNGKENCVLPENERV